MELKNKQSEAQLKEQEIKEKEDVFYTGKLAETMRFYLERAEKARTQRDTLTFDDVPYDLDYILNQRAANSFLRKKKNDDEIRIVGGATEKKIETVANELESLNLEAEILAFDDKDNELADLGRNFTDIVNRTNEIEQDDDMWSDAIIELLTQRAVFIEEVFTDKEVEDRRKPKNWDIGSLEEPKFIKKKHRIQRCEKRLLDGRQIFLGDITLPAYKLNEQPYIIKYDKMLYSEAEKHFGDWKMWQYVKPGGGKSESCGLWKGDFKWRMTTLQDKEVEVIKYMSYGDDEYQIIINGVMMLNPNTPLPWEYEGYNLTMTVLKSISRDCAYGRPLTASAKSLQGLSDEMMRLMVYKWRQSITPPLGTNAKQIYSKDIFSPATITQGVNDKTFSKLIDHQGITNSEFQTEQFIESKISEFIGADSIMQGMGEKGQQTAREVMLKYQQGIKNLGRAVLAYMRMKRDTSKLRLYNVMENYSQVEKRQLNPLSQEVESIYKKFTVQDGNYGDGKRGKKIIQFTDKPLQEEQRKDVYEYEQEQMKKGKPIRIEFINIKKLREIFTVWYVNVRQSEKQGSDLQKIMFEDTLNQSALISKLTGKPINGDEIVNNFERTWNAKNWFLKVQPVQQQAQDMMGEIDKMSGNSSSVKPNRDNKPTVNTLMGQ